MHVGKTVANFEQIHLRHTHDALLGKVIAMHVLMLRQILEQNEGGWKASTDRVSHPCWKDRVPYPSPGQTHVTQPTHSPTENQCIIDKCGMYEMSYVVIAPKNSLKHTSDEYQER